MLSAVTLIVRSVSAPNSPQANLGDAGSRRAGVPYLIVALALLIFAALAFEAQKGVIFAIDRWMLLALRRPASPGIPIGPDWLRSSLIDLTALGGTTVLTLVTIAAAGYLVVTRAHRLVPFLIAVAVSGSVLDRLLKALLGRERPTIVPHLVEVSTHSFPSGHAMNSAVVYLTVALVLGHGAARRGARAYLLGLAVALVAFIGISRVYLGVHFPSDVLGGWLVGGSWVTLCWRATFGRRALALGASPVRN
jgi:undecaprenyl-diphosphatase